MKKGGLNPQKQGLMDFQKLKQYPEALPLMNGGLKTILFWEEIVIFNCIGLSYLTEISSWLDSRIVQHYF